MAKKQTKTDEAIEISIASEIKEANDLLYEMINKLKEGIKEDAYTVNKNFQAIKQNLGDVDQHINQQQIHNECSDKNIILLAKRIKTLEDKLQMLEKTNIFALVLLFILNMILLLILF